MVFGLFFVFGVGLEFLISVVFFLGVGGVVGVGLVGVFLGRFGRFEMVLWELL